MANFKEIEIDKIEQLKNIRQNIKTDDLAELMNSIKTTGLMQPIGVKQVKHGYIILWGNRRLLACKKLGHKTIPAHIFREDEEMTEEDFLVINTSENIQRKNVDFIELGRICKLLKEKGLTIGEIAVRLSIPKTRVDSAISSFNRIPADVLKRVYFAEYGTTAKEKIKKLPSSVITRLSRSRMTKQQIVDVTNYLYKEQESVAKLNLIMTLVSCGLTTKQAISESERFLIIRPIWAINKEKLKQIIQFKDTDRKNSKVIGDKLKEVVESAFPGLLA